MMRSVIVKFGNYTTPYSYLVPEGDNPEIGDLVLTSIQFSCSYPDNAKVARVVEVQNVSVTSKATKFYLSLFKKEEFQKKAEQNAALVERERIRRDARARLDKMLADTDKMVEYRRLAEVNPEAAELLALL